MHSVSNINERFHHFWNLTRGSIGRNEDWIENQWISIVSLLRQRRNGRQSLPRPTRRLHFLVDSNSKLNRSWRSFCRVQRRLESVCPGIGRNIRHTLRFHDSIILLALFSFGNYSKTLSREIGCLCLGSGPQRQIFLRIGFEHENSKPFKR